MKTTVIRDLDKGACPYCKSELIFDWDELGLNEATCPDCMKKFKLGDNSLKEAAWIKFVRYVGWDVEEVRLYFKFFVFIIFIVLVCVVLFLTSQGETDPSDYARYLDRF